MKKVPSTILIFLLAALLGCGYMLAQTQQAIPPTFFGMHVHDPRILSGETSYPLYVKYGEFRNWDVYQVSWPDIETCEAQSPSPADKCFGLTGNAENFGALQYELQQLYSANPQVTNVMITLSRTPAWAVRAKQATDANCNYYDSTGNNPQYGGACYAPNGIDGENHLNPDGTGDDTIWINWVAAIATYVNNSDYCPNCAHVKYWEIWNEFNRNDPDTSLPPDDPDSHASWYALTGSKGLCTYSPCPTPDQLIRMTEDARCVITGTGYVDNYSKPGDQESCYTLEHTYSYPGPFDTNAEIVQPSIGGQTKTDALRCYLYCDSTACGNWYGGQCKNTWPNGAKAVDIMNFHYYAETTNPEELNTSALEAALNGPEQSKPLWVGEGSWQDSFHKKGNGDYDGWRDPYAQGGFIPRYFATLWAQTLPYGSAPCDWSSEVCQQAFWYGYDYITTMADPGYGTASVGALYCPGKTPHGSCSAPPEYPPSVIKPQADMWNVAWGWLQGAVPNAPQPPALNPFCNNLPSTGIWHCDFTVNGTAYSMAWDNSGSVKALGQLDYCAANFPNNPYVCGNTTYTVSPQFTYWEDLSGTIRSLNQSVPFEVGLNPVLLCPTSQCLP